MGKDFNSEKFNKVVKQLEEDIKQINKVAQNLPIKDIQGAVNNIQESVKYSIPENTFESIQDLVNKQNKAVEDLYKINNLISEDTLAKISPPPRKVSAKDFQNFRANLFKQNNQLIKIVDQLKKERKQDAKDSHKLSIIALYISIGSFLAAIISIIIFLING